MKIFILCLAALGLVIPFRPLSAATLKCPETIMTHQSLQRKVHGWSEFVDECNAEHNLEGLDFYAGTPQGHASLAPDNETTKGNKLIWTFGKDKIWLACRYTHSTIQLVQKLSEEIKSCTVTYESNFSKVTRIVCL